MKADPSFQKFIGAVQQWFAAHKRVLPWRDLAIKNPNERAYRILVSEVMLQQTQVDRVKIIFRRFLEQFPTLKDLARATNRDVLIAWRGMGYNSRALRLRDAARTIVNDLHGKFPKELDSLLLIKGIGPYTAAAVRNFAFDLPTPCLDTNIRRILHRVFFGPEKGDGKWKKNDTTLGLVATELLHEIAAKRVSGADWHAALMDFGSLVCTKRSPKCAECPLVAQCKSVSRMKTPQRGVSTMTRREPGRIIGGRFVPNRIIRGRIIEELRDAKRGLSADTIGARVCIDWSLGDHRAWLHKLLDSLIRDRMVKEKNEKYVLHE